MPRARTAVARKKRVKKVLKAAKGYYGAKSKQYRTAKTAVMRSLAYSYRDRRQKKRMFRRLWIARINAAARLNELSYSRLMHGLEKAGVVINRKMLSIIAATDIDAFAEIAAVAKKALA